ncbi:hypothetical protein MPSEU_000853100 [Mayamaea pseudoterrestris]|nr:hypothetical protein MPSEU_000853100 [Mayamaea pseudoterrestris]
MHATEESKNSPYFVRAVECVFQVDLQNEWCDNRMSNKKHDISGYPKRQDITTDPLLGDKKADDLTVSDTLQSFVETLLLHLTTRNAIALLGCICSGVDQDMMDVEHLLNKDKDHGREVLRISFREKTAKMTSIDYSKVLTTLVIAAIHERQDQYDERWQHFINHLKGNNIKHLGMKIFLIVETQSCDFQSDAPHLGDKFTNNENIKLIITGNVSAILHWPLEKMRIFNCPQVANWLEAIRVSPQVHSYREALYFDCLPGLLSRSHKICRAEEVHRIISNYIEDINSDSDDTTKYQNLKQILKSLYTGLFTDIPQGLRALISCRFTDDGNACFHWALAYLEMVVERFAISRHHSAFKLPANIAHLCRVFASSKTSAGDCFEALVVLFLYANFENDSWGPFAHVLETIGANRSSIRLLYDPYDPETFKEQEPTMPYNALKSWSDIFDRVDWGADRNEDLVAFFYPQHAQISGIDVGLAIRVTDETGTNKTTKVGLQIKNYHVTAKAASELTKEGTCDYHFLIMGDGERPGADVPSEATGDSWKLVYPSDMDEMFGELDVVLYQVNGRIPNRKLKKL